MHTHSRDILVSPHEERKDSFLDFLKELPILIIVAFGIALLIKTFLVQAFFIPSESMVPTLEVHDRVLVSKLSYRFGEPKRGQVVVFASPVGEGLPKVDRGPVSNFFHSLAVGLGLRSSERDFIKRVIATDGETVQVRQGALFVDDVRLDEPYLPNGAAMQDYGPYQVPRDAVFVMGDNRTNSQDSRVFGAISEKSIIGKAFIRIWPLNRLSLL